VHQLDERLQVPSSVGPETVECRTLNGQAPDGQAQAGLAASEPERRREHLALNRVVRETELGERIE
jgi:hypothetical protein